MDSLYPEFEKKVFKTSASVVAFDVVEADYARNLYSLLESARLDAKDKTKALDGAVAELVAAKQELEQLRSARNAIASESGIKPEESKPTSPLDESLARVQAEYSAGLARVKELRAAAPELSDWVMIGGPGYVNLVQFFPGPRLGDCTLMAQTSAMRIVSALGGRAEARGDGTVELWLKAGAHILLHRAVATFTINEPAKEGGQP